MDIFYSDKRKLMIAASLTMLCCILMVVFPSIVLDSARKAINLWMLDVLPALLPFFICAGFLQNMGAMKYLRSGIFPFAMSVLSGYPMGAGVIGGLRRNGDITLNEARQMLSYCSTSGPAFMIGAVGAGMLGSGYLGMVIALAHYSGALINGAVYRRVFSRKRSLSEKGKSKDKRKPLADEHVCRSGMCTLQEAFTDAILMSLKSLGIVLAYIVMFMFITDILTIGGVFALVESPWIETLLKGMLEMTVGCEAAAGCIAVSDEMKCILCSFIISWGGLSVMGQTMSMLAGTGISMGYILLTKLTHGLFSAAVAFVITSFML